MCPLFCMVYRTSRCVVGLYNLQINKLSISRKKLHSSNQWESFNGYRGYKAHCTVKKTYNLEIRFLSSTFRFKDPFCFVSIFHIIRIISGLQHRSLKYTSPRSYGFIMYTGGNEHFSKHSLVSSNMKYKNV